MGDEQTPSRHPPFELPDAVSQSNSHLAGVLNAPLSGPPPSTPGPNQRMDELPSFAGMTDHRPADLSSLGGMPGATAAPQPQPATPASLPATGVQIPPGGGASDPLGVALAQYGIDVSRFDSPASAMSALINLANEGRENRQFAELGRRAAPHWDRFQEFQQAGPTQPPAQPPVQMPGQGTAGTQPAAPQVPQGPTWEWNAPQWNPRWLDQVDPATGRLRDGADPTLITRISEYQDWLQNAQGEFFSDPQKLISRAMEPKLHEMNAAVEKLVKEQIDTAIRQYQEQQQRSATRVASEQRFAAIEDRLIVKDRTGRPVQDPLTGQYALTPHGKFYQQAYQNAVREARSIAQVSGQQIDDHALDVYASDFAIRQLDAAEKSGAFGAAQQPAQQPGQPQLQPLPGQPNTDAVVAQRNMTFMQEALGGQALLSGQRDGTVPDTPASPPQSPMRAPTMDELVSKTLSEMGHRTAQMV